MSGARWSVKGIDPRTREVAKDMARRSGMTLGEWLNTVIVSGDEEAGAPVPAPRREPAEESRFARPSNPSGGELARVTSALERLTQRIEAAEHRSSLAISGVDQSVQGVLARLTTGEKAQTAVAERVELVERDQTAVAARLDAALLALRDDHEENATRLHKLETQGAGPRSAEALKALESALGKIAGQMYDTDAKTRTVLGEIGREFDHMSRQLDMLEARPEPEAVVERLMGGFVERLERAEGQTAAAIRALETSFAGMDDRLRAAEARPLADTSASEARLEQLASDLAARFDAARAEMAAKLDSAADGRMDQVDKVVRDLTGHVAAAERRSAQAIEKMGHEVLRIADNLGRRMIGVETRTAEAVEHVGGEVARAVQTLETRARSTDGAHAEALEKLGGEIARISERLVERIGQSERRSAQAIDDVGEQVARATERINQRYDTAANDLAERIKQSEERTARFLEEARETIDQRLTEAQRKIAEQVTPVTRGFVDVSTRLEQMEATASYMPPFGQTALKSAPEPGDIFAEPPMRARMDPMRPAPVSAAPVAKSAPTGDREFLADKRPPAFAPAASAFDPTDDPFGPLDAFTAPDLAPAASPPAAMSEDPFEAPSFSPPPFNAPPPPAEPAGPLSTRDVLERARAAARANADAAARVAPAARPKAGGFLGRLKLPGGPAKRGPPKGGTTMRTALLASATAAALAATAAGSVIYFQDGVEPVGSAEGDPADPVLYGQAARAPQGGAVRAASLTLEPMQAAVVAPSPEASARAAAAYAQAEQRLNAGDDRTGVAALKTAAQLGSAPAQLHLARLYELGDAGLPFDPVESRRWTERAAQGGDRRAMHNLGLLYFEGAGGKKDVALATQWFRRAAELGLTDSQYNLGLVYENGYGVTKNAAEAYKWYVIAARGGDDGGRASAERLQRAVSPEAQSAAERGALAFRASGETALVVGGLSGAGVADIAAAQRALSGLGYYRGPTDGRASPALQAAVSAWQRARGLPADGVIDADLVSGLARAG